MAVLMPSESALKLFAEASCSPAPYQSAIADHKRFMSQYTLTVETRTSTTSDNLAPPPSPYPQQVDPSPTDSNGTESTDIEEDAQDEIENSTIDDAVQYSRPQSRENLTKLDMNVATHSRSSSDEAPTSVIHVPTGFGELGDTSQLGSGSGIRMSDPASSYENTSPSTPDAALGPEDKRLSSMTSPLNTNLPIETEFDRFTPRAQTRQEIEDEYKSRSRRTSSLEETIASSAFVGKHSDDFSPRSDTIDEVTELQSALGECWTLCNTLSNLSSNHRQRYLTESQLDSGQEHAWRSCWYLCRELYASCNDRSNTLHILEICREFCQALFDVRLKGDESVDSVLRVSFEMNNHLYNTHDRHLPEAFRERTLDFYVTLCHRMMKQQTSLARENDALLRACWSLAETLFNLRQVDKDARRLDELLASAIQACWNLSDIFREGWSYLRPDRSTPRPDQSGFSSSGSHRSAGQSERAPSSLSSEYHDAPSLPPETPTTIFDDATTASSPESVSVPNILVLGPAIPTSLAGSSRGTKHHDRWSSNASILSDYSESADSQRTSSTARASSDGKHLLRLRYLILKAALNAGFSRATGQTVVAFVKSLPASAFGNQTWQIHLVEQYKRLVFVDKSLRSIASMPGRSLTTVEIARAVKWLGRNEEWQWLESLYRLVLGFGVEEAEVRGGVIQI
ncbi:hypothetical protein E4T38_02699 [Aureobasidium subglaciale]|nr:hypothetical protein E4T38_02699 [Aureobasidium subglaciale]KAI5227637.1 hypothetical protein E4T40_02476 [Aureobasidium subglaciale]KAI5265154.1 hypothetical protein E4T46_02476 [Aureobasidium subglaciale]